jgi:hypothetical protein
MVPVPVPATGSGSGTRVFALPSANLFKQAIDAELPGASA